jgi:hypothetical protein
MAGDSKTVVVASFMMGERMRGPGRLLCVLYVNLRSRITPQFKRLAGKRCLATVALTVSAAALKYRWFEHRLLQRTAVRSKTLSVQAPKEASHERAELQPANARMHRPCRIHFLNRREIVYAQYKLAG